MYVRKTVRRYKDRTYVNYLLVESVLTPKGPRQKVVCSLGDLSPRPPEQWLALARKLQDALTGQMSLPGMADYRARSLNWIGSLKACQQPSAPAWLDPRPRSPPPRQMISWRCTSIALPLNSPRPAGHIHVGYEFWKRLGLDEILNSLGFSAWLNKVTCMMTFSIDLSIPRPSTPCPIGFDQQLWLTS